ncbi:hypothetical protein IF655_24310 [Streptomyces sp. DSM 110735]|uniref:hypothetical protein n=1 Tax=Streptomyces sp. DSM 110735 TaxID=2775031 RepID=UPI0018F7AFC7|nr:hypothetical protein [Streptomyces sp. DSM 110735]MBJ7906416.1 hypothetical protein [Streptomyces sp. DSM 110735]
MSNTSLWSKVDLAVRNETASSTEEGSSSASGAASKPWPKWKVWTLNVLGFLLWTYITVKLFVFDLDSYLIDEYAPWAQFALDYKFFIMGGIFIITLLFSKGRRLAYLYIIFFPLVIILWKIPKWLYKFRSWIAVFVVLNATTTFVRHFKFNAATRFLALLALILIGVSENDVAMALSAAYLGIYFVVLMVRTMWFAIKPSHFLRGQQKLVESLSEGSFTVHLIGVNTDLRDDSVQRFNASQLSTFIANLSNAVLMSKGVYFWAYQLEKYRTSAAALIVSTFSYASLYLQGIMAFTAINYTILQIDPAAFEYKGSPSIPQIAYYSLFTGAGSFLTPVSTIATIVKLAINIIGPLFLAALVTQFVISRRQVEQDAAATEAVEGIKKAGAELEIRFREEYDISTEEAIEWLSQLGESFALKAISSMLGKLPPDYGSGSV